MQNLITSATDDGTSVFFLSFFLSPLLLPRSCVILNKRECTLPLGGIIPTVFSHPFGHFTLSFALPDALINSHCQTRVCVHARVRVFYCSTARAHGIRIYATKKNPVHLRTGCSGFRGSTKIQL